MESSNTERLLRGHMKEIFNGLTDYTKNLFSNPLLKIAGAEASIIATSFNDAKLAIITILALVIIDTALGMMVAHNFGNISSWKFKKSIYKLLFYLVVVLLGSFSFVTWGVPWIKEAFVGLIISTEIISILENLEMKFPGLIPKAILTRLKLSIHKKRAKHLK
jgi:phage-related holin